MTAEIQCSTSATHPLLTTKLQSQRYTIVFSCSTDKARRKDGRLVKMMQLEYGDDNHPCVFVNALGFLRDAGTKDE